MASKTEASATSHVEATADAKWIPFKMTHNLVKLFSSLNQCPPVRA